MSDLTATGIPLLVACSAGSFVFGAGVVVGAFRSVFKAQAARLDALENLYLSTTGKLAAMAETLARIDERTKER